MHVGTGDIIFCLWKIFLQEETGQHQPIWTDAINSTSMNLLATVINCVLHQQCSFYQEQTSWLNKSIRNDNSPDSMDPLEILHKEGRLFCHIVTIRTEIFASRAANPNSNGSCGGYRLSSCMKVFQSII
jgi:hypothetical protein